MTMMRQPQLDRQTGTKMIKGLHQNSRGSGDKCPLVWVIQAASSKRVAVCAVDVMWPTEPTTLKHSCPLPHRERRHRAPHSCDLRPGVAATKNRLLPDAPFERRISGVWFWVRQDVFYPEAIDGAGHCGTSLQSSRPARLAAGRRSKRRRPRLGGRRRIAGRVCARSAATR
jgi:hypothetical protein